jgi:hypothetical protein
MGSKILVLNGPPRAGIEELVHELARAYNCEILSAYAATLSRAPRIIVPDAGFTAELNLLVDTYGADNLLMVHIIRQGCTFHECSRQYVDHPAVDAITMSYEKNLFDIGFLAYLFFELQVKQE